MTLNGCVSRSMRLRTGSVVVPTFTLAGRLLLPIGSEAARSLTVGARTAELKHDGTFVLQGVRAGSGRATIELADGARRSCAFALPGGPFEWPIEATDDATDEPGGEAAAEPASSLSPATGIGRLSVRVRTSDERGIPVRLLVRSSADGAVVRIAYSTRNGEALLKELPLGALRIEADSSEGSASGDAQLVDALTVELELKLAVPEPPP